MGLFAKLKDIKANRLEKKIARNLKLIKNPKAIREDRVAAIEFFTELDDFAVATPALLQRFEYSLEHGINDTREKDTSKDGIMKHGAKVVPLVADHLYKTTRIAWPLKILRELTSDSEMIAILLKALDFSDVSLDHDKVDKNYDLLCHLRDFPLPDPLQLLPFLSEHDERLRFAVTEVLLSQDNSEIPGKLERFLSDFSAENTRIHQAVTEAFLTHKWSLKDPGKLTNSGLKYGMYINQKNQLEIHSN